MAKTELAGLMLMALLVPLISYAADISCTLDGNEVKNPLVQRKDGTSYKSIEGAYGEVKVEQGKDSNLPARAEIGRSAAGHMLQILNAEISVNKRGITEHSLICFSTFTEPPHSPVAGVSYELSGSGNTVLRDGQPAPNGRVRARGVVMYPEEGDSYVIAKDLKDPDLILDVSAKHATFFDGKQWRNFPKSKPDDPSTPSITGSRTLKIELGFILFNSRDRLMLVPTDEASNPGGGLRLMSGPPQ